MPKKKEELESKSGLLMVRCGDEPHVVTVREEKTRGSNVILDYRDPRTGRRRKKSLGFAVRKTEKGKVIAELLERAKAAAATKAAELQLNVERERAEPARLTNRDVFDMYHSPKGGPLFYIDENDQVQRKASYEYVGSHIRARRLWEEELGASNPWNQSNPADIDAVAEKLRKQGKPAWAVQAVERLQIVWGWVTEKKEVEGLKNPARLFDPKKFMGGRRPERPRFSEDELVELIRVSGEVDPRFRLFLCFADESGARGSQIRTAWRSALDRPLAVRPSPEDAPYGWLVLRGVKGQADQEVFLTADQRAEIERAFAGHLRTLEERYQESGGREDYPLFPGGYLRAGVTPIRDEGSRRTMRPIGRTVVWYWLRIAEDRVGIKHMPGRALHGIRRAWAKYTRREIGKTAAARAGGWSREETMENIYAGERYEDMAASREAQERRRAARGQAVRSIPPPSPARLRDAVVTAAGALLEGSQGDALRTVLEALHPELAGLIERDPEAAAEQLRELTGGDENAPEGGESVGIR